MELTTHKANTMKTISIVYPSGSMVHADFAGCLAQLIAYSSTKYRIGVVNPKCSIIQMSRYMGVKQAIAQDADKILFIDSDQTFSYNCLEQLVNSGKDIIGAASLTRVEPIQYTCKDEKGDRIDFSKRTGLHKVHTNGFPLTLIDMEVFKKIPKPYFTVSFKDECWTGEDESFCHAARDAGYDIWIDADVKVGHLGVKEYI